MITFLLAIFLGACAPAEFTSLPVEEGADSGITPPEEEDILDFDSTNDPDPTKQGDMRLQVNFGEAVAEVEMYYGYCLDRIAEECPEWHSDGIVNGVVLYNFDFNAMVGGMVIDASFDRDGNSELEELVDRDEGGCYTAAGWNLYFDGYVVTNTSVVTSFERDDNCYMGINLTEAAATTAP